MDDSDSGPTREEFERAADAIKRDRVEQPFSYRGYDYIPDPTAGEIWDRMQQDRHPYPDRG